MLHLEPLPLLVLSQERAELIGIGHPFRVEVEISLSSLLEG